MEKKEISLLHERKKNGFSATRVEEGPSPMHRLPTTILCCLTLGLPTRAGPQPKHVPELLGYGLRIASRQLQLGPQASVQLP